MQNVILGKPKNLKKPQKLNHIDTNKNTIKLHTILYSQ